MKTSLLTTIIILLMAPLAGFGQSPGGQSALLVIYRHDYKHHWEPANLNPVVAIDGKNLVKIPDKTYFQMPIKSGEYVFDANPSKGGTYSGDHAPGEHGKLGSTVTVIIQPGTTCYLSVRQIKPLMFGMWSNHIERAAPDSALEDLAGLRRSSPKFSDPGVVYQFEPR
ncbi:MAG TPA: hypothetical protein VFQ24_06090 [Terriglobia bacterium]|nr:hypothetical protein [Terriglobia bacterium]